MLNIEDKEKQKAIVLALLDFLYLLLSLVLIYPGTYLNNTGDRFVGGFAAAASVYALGILYPVIAKLIKGEAARPRLSRVADIVGMLCSVLTVLFVVIYFTMDAHNWTVWAAYVAAGFAGAPSLFSLVVTAKEYIFSK